MLRSDGSLARRLDFGEVTTRHRSVQRLAAGAAQRLTRPRIRLLRGPDKYKVLDDRRRAAQIKARRALDLIDMMEQAAEGEMKARR